MPQTTRTLIAIGVIVAACLALVWRLRPAPITRARVTSITPGAPPVAQVALTYGPGIRPLTVIIDADGHSGAGSVTVEGGPLFAEAPLAGGSNGNAAYRVTTTAAYRVLGRLIVKRSV